MRAFWVKVFLTAFALHLTLLVHCELEFGDLVAFERKSLIQPDVIIFIHWAVYVGKGKVSGLEDIKKDDQDIFHITGYVFPKASDCIFDNMDKISGKPRKFNYLDNTTDVRPKEDMIKVIKEIHKNCGLWELFTNNCEHVATYVRYGEKHFEQIGAQASVLCKLKLPTLTFAGEKKNCK